MYLFAPVQRHWVLFVSLDKPFTCAGERLRIWKLIQEREHEPLISSVLGACRELTKLQVFLWTKIIICISHWASPFLKKNKKLFIYFLMCRVIKGMKEDMQELDLLLLQSLSCRSLLWSCQCIFNSRVTNGAPHVCVAMLPCSNREICSQ